MSIFPPHSRDICMATMSAGLAMAALSFASGVADADDSIWPTPPHPAIDSTLTVPDATTSAGLAPATLTPGTTATTSTPNGTLLPTLLVDVGTFLGQLGSALGAGTAATVPGA